MKAAKVTPVPSDYFAPSEFERIVDGTYAYCEWKGGRDFKDRPLWLRALILLLRWSGLSILDAVILERERLQGNRLFLYRHKTRVPVFVPLPEGVVFLLESLPNSNPRYSSGAEMETLIQQKSAGREPCAGSSKGEFEY